MPMATKEARREYQRQWIAKRRADFFADKRCVKCGSTEELNLDHIDPTKKVSHNIWSWSQVRRDAEIAKCQVLCLPCHKDKTAADRKYKRLHGHVGTYDRWGCRCGLCKAAKRVKNAKQYAVRKR
ncbi:HNH endonuclease [Mycobacterium phage LifeSavor]|nr:HNH endonuclease [Mycobacterium phage LifeSavor]